MAYFFERAEIGRKSLLDQGGNPALLYINLGGMKHYNHKHGYPKATKLLRKAGQVARRGFPRRHRCHYIGADRFAAFVDENGLEERLNTLFKEWRK